LYVIQVEGAICGRTIPNAPSGTTDKFKNRSYVSAFRVYQSKLKIAGMQVEYDGSIKSKHNTPDADVLEECIRINLNPITIDPKKGSLLPEFRDYITHFFGTYTSKMEFLGVKSSMGKMYFYGDPTIGTPFLIGKFGEKFHGMKTCLKNGISNIKPNFKRGWFLSSIPKYEEEETYTEDQFIDDEEYCSKLVGDEKEWAFYYFDEDELRLTIDDKEDLPGDSYEYCILGEEDSDDTPISTKKSNKDYSDIKKKRFLKTLSLKRMKSS